MAQKSYKCLAEAGDFVGLKGYGTVEGQDVINVDTVSFQGQLDADTGRWQSVAAGTGSDEPSAVSGNDS